MLTTHNSNIYVYKGGWDGGKVFFQSLVIRMRKPARIETHGHFNKTIAKYV